MFSETVFCLNTPNITSSLFTINNNILGSEITLTCNIPYTLSGSDTFVCSDNAMWTGSGTCGKGV